MKPVTKYGNSYKFYNFADDKSKKEYVNVIEPVLESYPDIHTVEMFLDHKDGFLGFTSYLAESLFGAHYRWSAYEVQFKTKSEHTVDDKRYDVELQIYHIPFHEEALNDNSGAEESNHRRLGGLLGEDVAAGEDHFQIF